MKLFEITVDCSTNLIASSLSFTFTPDVALSSFCDQIKGNWVLCTQLPYVVNCADFITWCMQHSLKIETEYK